MFLQGKVQGVTPTYPMLVSTVAFYLRVKRVILQSEFYSCGGLLDKFLNKINLHIILFDL